MRLNIIENEHSDRIYSLELGFDVKFAIIDELIDSIDSKNKPLTITYFQDNGVLTTTSVDLMIAVNNHFDK